MGKNPVLVEEEAGLGPRVDLDILDLTNFVTLAGFEPRTLQSVAYWLYLEVRMLNFVVERIGPFSCIRRRSRTVYVFKETHPRAKNQNVGLDVR